MASYNTGSDFLSGILNAQKAGGVFKKANEDYRGLDYFEDRYGQGIGDDGYLTGGITDMMFYDTDDDGIDDRYQSGPGQPRADSAPDGGPIFGGGAGGGGGGDGGGENSPFGNNPFDSYDMNSDGTITQYDASTGETNTYEYNDPNASFPQRFFGTAMTAADMVPTAGKFISSLASSAYDKFIDPADQAIAEMLGLTGSYDEQQQAVQDFTQSNIDKKESLALGLQNQANEYGFLDDDFSLGDISTSTVAELEDQALGINMNMTKQYNDAIAKAEAQAAAAAAKAAQDKINNAVASGALGYGQDEEGNFKGVVTNPQYNNQGIMTSNKPVTTGFNPNTTPNINNPAAVAAISANAEKQKAKNLSAFNERQKKQQQKEKDREGGDGGSSGGCFVEGTPIQMADGTTKEITTINVGEETKGGVVQAKMEFMPQNIYNYKDVLVSGSHWVVEDNQLVAVEDSKHGVLTDRVEPVYTFKTSNNRIWIYDIEFGDFETGSDADWEPHFEAVRQKLNKELSEKTT